jgi:hypothetical protein
MECFHGRGHSNGRAAGKRVAPIAAIAQRLRPLSTAVQGVRHNGGQVSLDAARSRHRSCISDARTT